METQQLSIREGGFYKAANGTVMRCLRYGDKVTTFSVAESPAVLEGPTESVGTVFVTDNGITEITENEYKRAVLAQRVYTGEVMQRKNTPIIEGQPQKEERPFEYFKDKFYNMDLPSVQTMFKEIGGYYDYQLTDEQDVIDRLMAASEKPKDDGAPVVIRVREADTGYHPVQKYIEDLKKLLEETQDEYWCPELRNAIVDLGSAINWLNEREQRLQAPAQNQPVIDGEAPAEESNVLPLRQ